MKTGCKHPTCNGGPCRRVKTEKKRTPLKRSTKRIKQVSKKQAKIILQAAKITKKDHQLYLEIWEERAHLDFETEELIMNPLTLNFHHVLEKHLYPEYRHEKWNIVLVNWETHDKIHRNIDLTPKIKAYRDELLKKYAK